MADSLPWTQKYRPRTTGEITGQGVPLQMLKRFVAGFGKQRKRAMLLYGPPGCGKTSSVHALANELGLELLEVNASDYRTAAEIEAKVGMASGQLSLFGTGKIILVDEIDGIAGQKDRGGVVTLAKLVAKSAFPIVITANNPFGKKFSALRKVAEMVEFQPLDYTAAEAVLEKVCRAEGITCPVDALKALALRCGGDVRGALTDLQILGIDGKITREELNDLSDRNRHIAMEAALTKVLKSTDPAVVEGAFDNVEEDAQQVMLWLDENVPAEYLEPADISRAYDMLSAADIFYGRIRRWQHWRFLAYVYRFLTVGVAVAKDRKYASPPKYRQPSRILKMYIAKMRFQKRQAIAEKIGSYTHTSERYAVQHTIPALQPLFRKGKGAAIAEELDLSAEEVAWLER